MGQGVTAHRQVEGLEDVIAVRAALLAVGRAGGLEPATRSAIAVLISDALRAVCETGDNAEVDLAVTGCCLRVEVRGPAEAAEALRTATRVNRDLIPGELAVEGDGSGTALRLVQKLSEDAKTAKTAETAEDLEPAVRPELAAAVETLRDAEGSDDTALARDRLARNDQEVRELLAKLEARKDALERLDAELEETNRGVVALYAELDQRDQHKNEFLATLAHELRNPLGVMGTAIHAVRDHRELHESAVRPLEVAERQLWHLARLVDDLLDVSRIDQGKINLKREHIDLAEVVRRAIDTSEQLYRDREHELTLDLADEPLPLDGDPVRLEQVVDNLLTNAAKYTPEGGRVEVRTRRVDGRALLTVSDNGVGISEEMLGRIFQLFAQADDSLDRSSGGLGLGLALVERLVGLHGGTVAAHSEGEGEGSRFTVRLPLATGDADNNDRDEEATSVENSVDRTLSVLLVEDNEDAREMLALLLQGRGFEVTTAGDGVRGVERFDEDGPFDAAVIDIGLPELDGYGVGREIRSREGGGGVLLVALSGYGRDEDRERSSAAGFDHHLVKPVEPAELCKILRDVGADADAG